MLYTTIIDFKKDNFQRKLIYFIKTKEFSLVTLRHVMQNHK